MEYLNQALNYIKTNRDILPFSIHEVHELLHEKKILQRGDLTGSEGGCPGTAAASFQATGLKIDRQIPGQSSELTQWPVQLHLINPTAQYFHGAHLLIAADCAAFAYGNFHKKFLTGKKVVIACPKLDQGKDIYIKKFISLIDDTQVSTITVVIMEVPCCGGLAGMVKAAMEAAIKKIPVQVNVISTRGAIIAEYEI